jgi:hypothetical protein
LKVAFFMEIDEVEFESIEVKQCSDAIGNQPYVLYWQPPKGESGKKRKKEDDGLSGDEGLDEMEPNEWLLAKVSKKGRESSPLSLLQLLENWGINKKEGMEGNKSSFANEGSMSEDKELHKDWMKTYLDVKLLLSRVDTL